MLYTSLSCSLPSGLSRRERQLAGYTRTLRNTFPEHLRLSVGHVPAGARFAGYGSQPVVIPPGQARRKSHGHALGAGLPTPPRWRGSPDPAVGVTGGLPEFAQIVAFGDLRSDVARARRPRCFTHLYLARFRRACPGGSDNWRATLGRYGTPFRSICGSPSGMSRREHDLQATVANQL